MKPLDFVRTPGGGLAIVTEVGERGDASITYLNGCNPNSEYNAWWHEGDGGLVVLDSLPRLLASTMAHPFGSNGRNAEKFFPLADKT